jgi:molecular chaperone GrpE
VNILAEERKDQDQDLDTKEALEAKSATEINETGQEPELSAADHDGLAEEAESTENGLQNELNSLETALLEERKKVEELTQRYLRSQADFDNYRKRMQKEKEDLLKYASRSLLEKLLPAVDNLERAIESSKQTGNLESLVQGVEMVYRQIMDALKEEGAVPIEAVGKPFDPYIHQAVAQVESDGQQTGIVVEEYQKGYMLKDKLIRPSMVKVTT